MRYVCIIVGDGPAGLSAALVLGRAKLNVLIIDNKNPRNQITHESHGFITNDSLSPLTIREKGKNDLAKYQNIHYLENTVEGITDQETYFAVKTVKNLYEAT